MKLRVRNFLGIISIDLELPEKGIVLASGQNEAGKSSLLEAFACAVLMTHQARGMRTKASAVHLLRRGAEAGSISLEYGRGAIRITYPDAKIDQTGAPIDAGSALGIGALKLMDLTGDPKGEWRTQEIAERFGFSPTLKDLREWCAERPGLVTKARVMIDGVPQDIDLLDDLWRRIEVSGWDAVHKDAAETGTKLKGRWEAITGRKFGTSIAKSWLPETLLEGEEYDLDVAKQDVADAAKRLEAMVSAAAVSRGDRARLEAEADTVEARQVEDRRLMAEANELQAQYERLVHAKNQLPPADEGRGTVPCPHCAKPLRFIKDGKGYTFIEKAPPPLHGEALKKARADLMEADAQIRACERLKAVNAQASAQARADRERAEKAKKEAIRLQEVPDIDEDAVSQQRETLLRLERVRDAVKAHFDAKAIYAEWASHSLLVEALSPAGVRKVVLGRRLGDLNELLDEFAGVAQFKDVRIGGETMMPTYGGIPYSTLSESGKWRVDLLLAAVIGQKEGAKVMVVDRFDVIHPQARPGVLMLLKHLGVSALVGMTGKDRAAMPDLGKVKMGRTIWLKDGAIEEVAEASHGES